MQPYSTSLLIEQSTGQKQPIAAAQLADALLKIQTVVAVTGLSASTVYRRVAAGTFPEPIDLGKRCKRWKSGAVTSWIRNQA
jgi:prophage regulatory protein